jgi:hypothetical protein
VLEEAETLRRSPARDDPHACGAIRRSADGAPTELSASEKERKSVTTRYRFVARQTPSGQVRIDLELQGEPVLPLLDHGTIGFEVRPGATLADAQTLARLLNREIVGVTYIEE